VDTRNVVRQQDGTGYDPDKHRALQHVLDQQDAGHGTRPETGNGQ